MPSTITITCPECGNRTKGPENLFGKKVRCKECDHAFVVKGEAGEGAKPAAKPAAKAAPAKAAPAKPGPAKAGPSKAPAKPAAKPPAAKAAAKPVDDDEDEEGEAKPYDVTNLDLTPRCPNCANEMESEDAVICLTCGYNTHTRQQARTRKVHDVTGMERFMWLLPGILCVLAIFLLIGADVWYVTQIDDMVEKESFLGGIASSGGIKLWMVIMSLFGMFVAGRFAVKRLIFNNKVPETEKLK